MKRKAIFYLMMITTFASYGQNKRALHTNVITDDNSKTTYQYYEDPNTFAPIKHGIITYTEKERTDYGFYYVHISGHFKNGYKNGLWTFRIDQKDYPNTIGTYSTGTLTAIQNFKDGIPNGAWSVNNTWKSRGRYCYLNGTFKWAAFENPHNESFSTILKNSTATGLTKFKSRYDNKESTLNLNQKGFLIGCYGENKSFKVFDCNGTDIYVLKTKTNGETLSKVEVDSTFKIGKKYLDGKLTKTELTDLRVKVDTTQYAIDDIKDILDNDCFFLAGVDGDINIYKKVYSYSINMYSIGYIPFRKHQNWPQISQDDSPSNKIEKYSSFLIQNIKDISKEDADSVNSLIAFEKESLKSEETENNAKIEYYTLQNQINDLIRIPFKQCKTEKKEPYSYNTHSNSKIFEDDIAYSLNHIKELIFNYKCNEHDFDIFGYKLSKNNYTNSLNTLKDYIKYLESIQNKIDSLSIIYSWGKDIIFNANEIECKEANDEHYSLLGNLGNVYKSESSPKLKQKDCLYNAYLDASHYLTEQINKCTSFLNCYEYMQQMNNLCWYMANAWNIKTSSTEKEIKKTNDPKIKLDIFMSEIKKYNQNE